MRHRAQGAILGGLTCCAVCGSLQAAPIAGIANFQAAPSVVNQVWCCRNHHRYYYPRLRWYWSPKPYNCHFDLYYGYLAAHSIREKPCRS